MIISLFILQACILGGIAARLDGGGITKMNEWLERAFCMFYFVLACIPTAGIYSVLSLLGTFGIATGHGQYFPDMNPQKCKPEYFDFIVKRFFGEDKRTTALYVPGDELNLKQLYKRNAFGMFVTGSLVGLPAAILSISFGNLYGVALLFTGVAKAVSYIVSDKLYGATEPAEFMNGFLRTLLCMITLFGAF